MCPTLQENVWIKGLVKSDFFSDRSAQDNISPNVCEHLFRSRNNRLQTSLSSVKKNHTCHVCTLICLINIRCQFSHWLRP